MDGRGYSPGRSTSLFKASGLHPPQIVHPRCEASTFHSISTPLLRHSNEEGVRIPVRQGDRGPNHPWMEQLLLRMGHKSHGASSHGVPSSPESPAFGMSPGHWLHIIQGHLALAHPKAARGVQHSHLAITGRSVPLPVRHRSPPPVPAKKGAKQLVVFLRSWWDVRWSLIRSSLLV